MAVRGSRACSPGGVQGKGLPDGLATAVWLAAPGRAHALLASGPLCAWQAFRRECDELAPTAVAHYLWAALARPDVVATLPAVRCRLLLVYGDEALLREDCLELARRARKDRLAVLEVPQVGRRAGMQGRKKGPACQASRPARQQGRAQAGRPSWLACQGRPHQHLQDDYPPRSAVVGPAVWRAGERGEAAGGGRGGGLLPHCAAAGGLWPGPAATRRRVICGAAVAQALFFHGDAAHSQHAFLLKCSALQGVEQCQQPTNCRLMHRQKHAASPHNLHDP